MDNNYIERNPEKIETSIDQAIMAKNYYNMLNNVANMIATEGPVYSVWIYFQIGISNPLIFNSSSTNPKKNLIASLSMTKSCAGVANTFSIVIQYDPFAMGQNPSDELEILDEYVARAMSEDFASDFENNALKGKIQYGYNSTSDAKLVSPLYTFYITDIKSNVKFDSGITTYTISGTSTLAADCDFTATFPAVEDKPLMQVIEETLYKYYGDSAYPPPHISGVTPMDNDLKYRIDIPDSLYNDCVNITENASSDNMTPLVYCKNLLAKYNLTKSEKESGDFDDTSKLSINKTPRYSLYLTDNDGCQTIHITHFAPSSVVSNGVEQATEKSLLNIDYTFTWGLQEKNIVVGWSPEVDLQTYVINKAMEKRYAQLKQLVDDNPNNLEYKQKLASIQSYDQPYTEMYNATLQIVGIPADPPEAAEIIVKPRLLESVSRTSGVYAINGCEDNISTSGVYVTTLSLFRLRNVDTDTKTYSAPSTTAKNSSKNTGTSSSNNSSGGWVYTGSNARQINQDKFPIKARETQ